MAAAYYGALAVLGDELLGEDPLLEAAVVIADDMDEILEEMEDRQRHRQPTRVEGYVELVIPRYTIQEFKSHFRMERESFENLQQLLQPHLTSKISLIEKLLAALWLLGNKESFRSVGDRFNLSKSSLHRILLEVCESLKIVQPQLISWPNRYDQVQNANIFLRETGFPGVVGCIDGSYIPIPGPSVDRADYICRKGFPCIQLQAVCDNNLRFLDVFTGWPGSVHDARVFRNSPLREMLENGNIPDEQHLLGDSAYALATYMMVPFRDNGHFTPEQISYNKCHSSTRVVIERAFGLLKSKFRRLQYLDMRLIVKIPLVILSACVLHNFILITEKIDVNDELQDFDLEVDDHVPQVDDVPPAVNNTAVMKRRALADLLA